MVLNMTITFNQDNNNTAGNADTCVLKHHDNIHIKFMHHTCTINCKSVILSSKRRGSSNSIQVLMLYLISD